MKLYNTFKDVIEPDDLISRINKQKLTSISSLIYSPYARPLLWYYCVPDTLLSVGSDEEGKGIPFRPLEKLLKKFFIWLFHSI